jgi:plasmid stabilization system protein ParE
MTATVRFHPAARAEHDAVVDWYEAAEHGIGLRFAGEVAVAIARIGQRPLAYPLWKRGAPHRTAVLAGFPYLIIFMELSGGIGVMAIAHAKRKPGYWRARQLGKPA